MGPDVRGRTHTSGIVNVVRYHVQQCDELRKSQNCGIVVAGYHENEVIDFYGIIVDIPELEHLYDVPEKENLEAESDELHIENDEVYQDVSLENNSIVNDSAEILDDDCNQEDDTIIEYISDHEENEGNNSTNNDEIDSTFDSDDIGW
ncbi:hypothetical protein H5410_002831 [Solanum commersonii]|uniref:Uncharacterized protein n=1 Tax=Solanum commersonii TaxID=4109 RepID=A0A9J6B3F4_SOLCO|nr:hypothetical protein H5410_002831 [Solanum commersonii]